MRRAVSLFRAVVWLALSVACCFGMSVQADDPPSPLRFRRVYVPEDDVANWPRANERYLPVEPAEFDRLVSAAGAKSEGSEHPHGAQLVRSHYSAELKHDTVLGGTAKLEFTHTSDAPVLVPLSPFGLSIEGVSWDKPGRQAIVGTGPDGRFYVLVEAAGELEFNWSVEGQRDATGVLQFPLELPQSGQNSLDVSLPATLLPSFSQGVVVEDPPQVDAVRNWHVVLGGRNQLNVRLTPVDPTSEVRRRPLVKMRTTYRYSERGIDVSCELRLDVPYDPIRRVRVALDQGLQLLAAHDENESLRWSAGPDDETGRRVIVIELAQPFQGSGQVLRLEAMAPLTINHLHVLPRIVPQGLAWQEGTISLLVPAPLQLTQFVPQLCRQTRIEPLSLPLSGESLEMQCFSSRATAQVSVDRHDNSMLLSTGTLVELGDGEYTARVVGRCQLVGGNRFTTSAAVPVGWMIDSVETVPRDALTSWNLGAPDGPTRKLSIRFSRALTVDRSVQLVIMARGRSLAAGKPLGPADLRVATFAETKLEEELVALRALGPNKIQLETDDDITRLPVSSLTEAERELFAGATLPDVVLRLDPRASRWRATLQRQSPEFSAELAVQTVATANKLLESYELRCVPGPTPLERLIVHFTQVRSEAPRWSLAGQNRGEFLARKLTPQEQSTLGGPEGESWEIVLRHPRVEPFMLRAARSTLFVGQTPISLAAVPEAAEQSGRLVIRADGGLPLAIHNTRLQPTTSSPAASGSVDTTRTVYHYDPARETNRNKPAIALELLESQGEQHGAFVWSRQIDSRCEPAGRDLHWMTLHLQNMGREGCSLELPEGSEVLGLWVDDTAVTPLPPERRFGVALPRQRKFPVVVVEFATRAAPWGLMASFEPPRVTVDMPVLAERRMVWLPPGYEMLSAGGSEWQSSRQPPFTWSQRLFGPFGRTPTQRPFDPASREDWSSLLGRSSVRNESQAIVQQFLAQLGSLSALTPAGTATPHITWGEALEHCHVRVGERTVLLRIDRVALAEVGVWSTTALPTPADTTAHHDPESSNAAQLAGLERLHASGLMLLIDDHSLVITSATAVAVERWQLTALGASGALRVLPGPLASRLASPLADDASRFVTLPGWHAESPTPWTAQLDASGETTDNPGWTVCVLEGSAGREAESLHVVRQASVRVGAWAALLGIVVLGSWLGRTRPVWLVRAAAVLAAFALLLPASVSPLAAGAFVGTLIALVVRVILAERRPSRIMRRSTGSSITLALPAEAIALALLISALAVCSTCFGQPADVPPAATAPAASSAAWVLIPADKDGKPTGARYHVPAEFDAELRRRAAAAEGRANGWLITQTSYQLTFVRDMAQTGLDVTGLLARYDLHVLDKGAIVRIPLRPDEARLVPDTATLDGRNIAMEWDGQQHELLCYVPEPGKWRLEFLLRPAVSVTDNHVGLDVHVPRVPHASLEVRLPPEAPGPDVPAAIGPLVWSADHQTLSASLGPTDRLALRWPTSAFVRNGTPAAEVEQLVWLRVNPGSVILDTRFKLHVPAGQISELKVAADPRLRRLPLVNSDVPLSEIRSTPGDPLTQGDARVQHLVFSQPVTGDVTVQMSFMLTGTTGVGNVRLPRLEVLDLPTSRRWLAVSVDSALEYEDEAGQGIEPVSPPDFLAAWTQPASPPQLVYSIPRGETHWNLSTEVREPRTTARQNLALSFFAGGVDVQFDARLKTRDGYTFQHRLTAPEELEITSISLLEDGVQRVSRWSHPERGPITVFLTAPVTGSQRLSLRGTLRTPAKGPMPLPIVRLDGAEFASATIEIERQPGVLVTVKNIRDLAEPEEVSISDHTGQPPRPVAMYTVESESPSAQIVLQPNHPQVGVTQLLSLKREGQQWHAEVDAAWTVSGGLLDVLRFEIPPQWTGPFTIHPSATSEVVDVPGQSRRQLVIYPLTAIADSQRLTIRGPLTLGPNEPVSAPNVMPLGAQRTERFYRLPSQLGAQQYDWETMHLRAGPVPPEFAPPMVTEAAETYYAVGATPSARLRSVDRVTSQPQVSLSDVHVAWHGDKTYQGIATFDLDPAELQVCTLTVPNECRLVQTYVDGCLTTPLKDKSGEWLVPLRLRQLPQRVEVIFTGTLSDKARSWTSERLSAPMLRLPAAANTPKDGLLRETFWTIYGPANSQPLPDNDIHTLTPVRYELARLRSMTNLMNLSADDLSALEPDEVALWYRGWRRRWESTRDALRRYLLSMRQSSQTLAYADEVTQLERELAGIASRLGVVSPADAATDPMRLADQPGELWVASIGSLRPTVRLQVSGAGNLIDLRDPRLTVTDFYARLGWVVLAVAAGVGLIAARARGLPLDDWVRRWPAIWGVLAGLLWWLWLVPSVLGLVIVALSLLGSLRPGFGRVREPSSAVVRLGHSGS